MFQVYSFDLSWTLNHFPKLFYNKIKGNISIALSQPQPQFNYVKFQPRDSTIVDLQQVLVPNEIERSIMSRKVKN